MYQTVYLFTCTQTAARAIYQLSSTIKKEGRSFILQTFIWSKVVIIGYQCSLLLKNCFEINENECHKMFLKTKVTIKCLKRQINRNFLISQNNYRQVSPISE